MTTREDWIKAGQITAEVKDYSKSLIKPGVKLLDAAEKIEGKIKELGGEVGFPVNISLNDCAAHYTPTPVDESEFDDEVIKIDIGVSVNGAIGDSAYTVDLSGQYNDLVKASVNALNNATKIIASGITLGEIGRTIQETIESEGFSSVKNLSGHGLAPYSVHSGMQVPNYNTGDKTELREGMIFAVEPFATDGKGLVKDSGEAIIYSQIGNRPVRDMTARKVLSRISEFQGLPFATRHLSEEFGYNRLRLALRNLKLAGNLQGHPPLVEVGGGMVSQAENSFMIDSDGKVIVLTEK